MLAASEGSEARPLSRRFPTSRPKQGGPPLESEGQRATHTFLPKVVLRMVLVFAVVGASLRSGR